MLLQLDRFSFLPTYYSLLTHLIPNAVSYPAMDVFNSTAATSRSYRLRYWTLRYGRTILY